MATVSLRQEYSHSASVIWSIIGDPGDAASWIPSLDASRLEGDIRHLTFSDGNPARERIAAHDDENRTYTYEYIDGPLPLARYTSTIQVDEAGAGSVVLWNAEFRAAGDDTAAVEEELSVGIGAIYRSALDEINRLARR